MKLCKVCGSGYLVQGHHIISGRGCRKEHENEFSVIDLCWYCHHGTSGVHGKNGRQLNLKLKRDLQEVYTRQGYSENEIRVKMGGKLY